MAFNITDLKQLVAQIPKEYQNSFASLLKSKKFPKDTFFGGAGNNKPTSKGYRVKVSRHILRKEKEEHLLYQLNLLLNKIVLGHFQIGLYLPFLSPYMTIYMVPKEGIEPPTY